MRNGIAVQKNDKTGEELYYTTHSSGLGIYIIPKKDYSKTYAIFGTRYGSVDSKFVVPGESELTEVPDGIAHYLEHKMFDQPDGSNVFDKFSRYGGNANAFTSFNITAYLFSQRLISKKISKRLWTMFKVRILRRKAYKRNRVLSDRK